MRQKSRVERIVRQRVAGHPLPYIIRHLKFGGLNLYINRNILVPRPATECLIDAAKSFIGKKKYSNAIRIFDIGTGSGVIAISIGQYCLENNIKCNIIATDISKSALAVARRNIARHNFSTIIKLRHTNLLDAIRKPADLIVANLPYLSPLEAKGLADPHAALVGGKLGHEMIIELLSQIKDRQLLKPRGAIMLEIGHSQVSLMRQRARCLFPGANTRVLKDLEGWNRVLTIQPD